MQPLSPIKLVDNLQSLMPYLEWELVESIMENLAFFLKEREHEMKIHLEMIVDYLEKCVRKTFGGMMAEYGV